MTRFLAILIATACAVSAQTYRTVTAGTNDVIRTNFTIASGQVIGLSNVTTNIAASNLTGLVSVAQGGTGASNAAGALVNLLPSYTGNSNRILGLNSNATAVIWTTNSGGGGGGTGAETRIMQAGGYNVATVSGTTNFSTNFTGSGFIAGSGASLFGTETGAAAGENAKTDNGFAGGYYAEAHLGGGAVGKFAFTTNGGGAVGQDSSSFGGGFAGGTNADSTNGGVALGRNAVDEDGGAAVGRGAIVAVSGSTLTNGGGAVGAFAFAQRGFAGGNSATSDGVGGAAVGKFADADGDGVAAGADTIVNDGAALGKSATAIDGAAIGKEATTDATNGFQFGIGNNSTDYSVQLFSAGSVDTNEWAYLASVSTKGGSRMTNTNGVTVTNTIIGYDGTNYTTNTITVIDGIITSWTQ